MKSSSFSAADPVSLPEQLGDLVSPRDQARRHCALTMICLTIPGKAVPKSFFCAVVTGTKTVSS